MCCITLIDLQVSLSFYFTILIVLFLDVSLFGLILFGTLCAFCIWLFLLQVWEIFSYINFIKYIFKHFLSVFSFWAPYSVNIGTLDIVLDVP